ncbi:MAG: PspC domain-containing protein [Ignavibacteriales bacterium]|nr:PspC domain-containing protein [Ignavibacteriales bacterium]
MLEEENKNSAEENLFDKMANEQSPVPLKKLQRSKSNVVIAGVCSGIAEYLKMDPATIRIIALLTVLLGGWSAIAYIITSLLLPIDQNPKQLSSAEINSIRKVNFRTILSGLLILIGFHFALVYIGIGSGERIFILPNGFVFPFASMIFGITLLRKNVSPYDVTWFHNTENYSRSRSDKIIFGICGGFGKYLNIDAAALRIIFILATLLTLGLFAIAYIYFGLSTPYEMEQKFE